MNNNKIFPLAIIGLGAIGSAALRSASEAGISCIGFDTYQPPHIFGSSHGETRITRFAVGENEAYIPLAKASLDLWQKLEKETNSSLFYQTGGTIIAPPKGGADFHGIDDFIGHSIALAKKHTIDYQHFNTKKLQKEYPDLNIQTGEEGFYEPQAGLLYVEEIIKQQLTVADTLSTKIQYHEKVLQVQKKDGYFEIISNKGFYKAEKVLMTVGPWENDFSTLRLKDQAKVFQQKIFWFEVEDQEKFSVENFPWIIWIDRKKSDFLTLFATPPYGTQGLKLMTESYHHVSHPDLKQVPINEKDISEMYSLVAKKVSGVKPTCLKTAQCWYTVTADQQFKIRTLSPNYWQVSACSGHGFKHSAGLAKGLVEKLVGIESQLTIDDFFA